MLDLARLIALSIYHHSWKQGLGRYEYTCRGDISSALTDISWNLSDMHNVSVRTGFNQIQQVGDGEDGFVAACDYFIGIEGLESQTVLPFITSLKSPNRATAFQSFRYLLIVHVVVQTCSYHKYCSSNSKYKSI
jgi:hypothetical protein